MLKIFLLSTLMLMSLNLESKETNSKLQKQDSYVVNGKRYFVTQDLKKFKQTGIASWYGSESVSKTANGEKFKPNGISAAHKTLPLGTKIKVTNLENGKSLFLKVNDRGPYKSGRIIDLSKGAAKKLGIEGLSKVEIITI